MEIKYNCENKIAFCPGDLYYEPSEASILVYTKNGWEYINSPTTKPRLCQSCGAPVGNGNRCSYCGVLY